MSPLRYLIPTLFAVARTLAGECSGTTTIANAPDATAVAACPIFKGDVIIDPKVDEELIFGTGLTQITGNFLADNATKLPGISAEGLTVVGGKMYLFSLTAANTLSFPVLQDVGQLILEALPPNIYQVDLALEKVDFLSIQDTSLVNLDGINVKKANQIEIANNKYVSSIMLDVEEVSGKLQLTANGAFKGGVAVSFPKLTTAKYLTVANATNLDIGSLQTVKELLTVQANSFSDLSVPQLTTCGGLTIAGNDDMKSLSIPKLNMVSGAINVANNSDFTGTVSFPSVKRITGALDLQGSFSSLSFPKLTQVQGDVTILSTSKKLTQGDCNHFFNGLQALGGHKCTGGETASQVGSVTGTTSSSGSKNTGNAAPIADARQFSSSIYGFSGFVAAMFGLFL